jgi:hypothetical protein
MGNILTDLGTDTFIEFEDEPIVSKVQIYDVLGVVVDSVLQKNGVDAAQLFLYGVIDNPNYAKLEKCGIGPRELENANRGSAFGSVSYFIDAVMGHEMYHKLNMENEPRYAKRIARLFHTLYGIKLPSDVLTRIGNIVAYKPSEKKQYAYIEEGVKGTSLEYGHKSSCWWSEFPESPYILEDMGGGSLRLFEDTDFNSSREGELKYKPNLRIWYAPISTYKPEYADSRGVIIFNNYSHFDTLEQVALMISQLTGEELEYHSYYVEESAMYVNNERVLLVVPKEESFNFSRLSYKLSYMWGSDRNRMSEKTTMYECAQTYTRCRTTHDEIMRGTSPIVKIGSRYIWRKVVDDLPIDEVTGKLITGHVYYMEGLAVSDTTVRDYAVYDDVGGEYIRRSNALQLTLPDDMIMFTHKDKLDERIENGVIVKCVVTGYYVPIHNAAIVDDGFIFDGYACILDDYVINVYRRN